jgi:three-Cys-motif partner protein
VLELGSLMSKDFFEKLRPWSARKHRLLQKYLAPFIAKVARTTNSRTIYIVDGFAGSGTYTDGTNKADGSPVLIAKFGEVCLRWTDPVHLRVVNVEADKDNEGIFENLEEATRPWVDSGIVLNIRDEFGTSVPRILGVVGDNPTLFFIDPFGPTDLRFADIEPILSRVQGVTELMINFDQDGLRRIADAALSKNTESKTAETNAANITAIIGSDGWREKLEGASLKSSEAEDIMVNEYKQNLKKFGFQVVAYPIREELNSHPKYHFVHCTRHYAGVQLMNDFICEEEDRLYGEHVEGKLSLFAAEASLENVIRDRRKTLRRLIEKYLVDKKDVTRGKIIAALIRGEPGLFHTKDVGEVVKDLLSENRLREANGKTRINDDDILIVHNDYEY